MIKTNKIMSAVVVGAVGVLALGACSSPNDQAAPANSETPAPTSREAAQAAAEQPVLAATNGGKFSEVVLTHSPKASCTRTDSNTKVEFKCRNISTNLAGDPVLVRVPDNDFQINVVKTEGAKMQTFLRSWWNSTVDSSTADDVTWKHPKRDKDSAWGWGVGVWSGEMPKVISATITVTKV